MARPVQGNKIARRVVDDLIEFSGQTSVNGYMNFFKAQHISELRCFVNRMREEVQACRNQTAQLNALIAEMEAFDDPGEVFDTLMGLRNDFRVEDAKLMGLNDLIAHAEEEIEMKEAYGLRIILLVECSVVLFRVLHVVPMILSEFDFRWLFYSLKGVSLKLYPIVSHGCEVMSIWTFSLADGVDVARGSNESFIALMRDLCSALRVSIAKNRRLIAKLEALGQRAEALKPLDYINEIVGRDSATLGVLEQLLAGTHVGMRLKASYVAEIEETD
ncbi:hypothetical protein Tco_0865260 [Tanacetum coccineum]